MASVVTSFAETVVDEAVVCEVVVSAASGGCGEFFLPSSKTIMITITAITARITGIRIFLSVFRILSNIFFINNHSFYIKETPREVILQ